VSTVETRSTGAICRIRIRRPASRNALDEDVIERLHAALDGAEASADARVIVLESEGKTFCAGADLAYMRRQAEASAEENERSARRLALLYERLDASRKPLIARVQGAAMGGGVGLVAASDIAIASPGAIFALTEVRLGLVAAVISPYVLEKIGASRARELVLTARRFGADEARGIGLVHRIAPDDKDESLDIAVEEAAREVLLGGPGALARVK
jgi:methylglutaconyl-CoA hydratase